MIPASQHEEGAIIPLDKTPRRQLVTRCCKQMFVKKQFAACRVKNPHFQHAWMSNASTNSAIGLCAQPPALAEWKQTGLAAPKRAETLLERGPLFVGQGAQRETLERGGRAFKTDPAKAGRSSLPSVPLANSCRIFGSVTQPLGPRQRSNKGASNGAYGGPRLKASEVRY